MAVYTPQNNMVFATLQEDLTDDGAETPSLTPSYIRLTEAKTAEAPAEGYVIVAGDSRRVPDDTEWAMYEYTGKGDQSANGTDDSLTNLARAVSNNRSFTSSHTFTGGSADVVLVNSADQFNDLLAIFNGNANWPAGQNAGGNSLTNQSTGWSDFNNLDLSNVLNKAQLAKDGSENLTGDLTDDQGNTIYDYSTQEIALAVIQNVLSHSDLTDAPTDAHHTDPTAGTGITDEGTNQFGLDVVLSGQVTLSSGVATIDTTLSATDATFMLALGIDDPNADCEVAGRVFWDDSAGTYKIKILEQNTSVGNPTVNYDVVRVR